MKKEIFCFLGIPASGKGTQANILAKKVSGDVLGIGELVRREINSADISDPLFAKMKEDYDHGTPQSDEIVFNIVKKNIAELNKNIIFDNYPFSKKQTEMFRDICSEFMISNPKLIIVNLGVEEAIRRMNKRRVCSKCSEIYIDTGSQICKKCGGRLIARSDDNEETIRKRVDQYLPRIKEVKEIFKQIGKVFEIDGNLTIEEVSKEIERRVLNAKA